MSKASIAVCLLILLCSCSTTKKIQVSQAENEMTVIDYSATRRGAYILKAMDGRSIIVSEPAPDVAKEITTSLGLSAETISQIASPELKAAYASKVIDLASRSQTLQVLRESMFRLSEMGASSDLTVNQRVALFTKVLDTVKVIAATELSNSDAPKEVKKALKNFLENTGTGTIPTN